VSALLIFYFETFANNGSSASIKHKTWEQMLPFVFNCELCNGSFYSKYVFLINLGTQITHCFKKHAVVITGL
jgi:hypothetical protein